MPIKVYPTQTGVRIIVPGQGIPGPPGDPGGGGDVEDLTTQGANGTVPTSDGAGGLAMLVPSGSGNVISPGSETAGNIAKFTGSNNIDETAITEAELETLTDTSNADALHGHTAAAIGADPTGTASGLIATHAADANVHHAESHDIASHSDTAATGPQLDSAISHSTIVTGNPHALDSADVGADPAGTATGLIATHAALGDVHHAEAHTLESHTAVATTGAQLDAHLASTANPHATDIANLGTGTLAELNTRVTDATLDTSSASRPPNGTATGDLSGTYPAPVVDGIQGEPVSAATPTEGQVFAHLSGTWTPTDPSGGGGPGSDTTAIHHDENNEFDTIADDATPPSSGRLIAETAAGVKFRVDIGNLPTGGGGESNDLASIGTLGEGLTAVVSKSGITLQTKNIAPTSAQIVVTADGNDNVLIDVDGFEIPIITKNSGFENRTDSVLSKVDGTRTFSIAPAVTDFKVWVEGVKYVISSQQDVVWDDTTSAKTFYFDNTGTLQVQNSSITGADQRTKGLIAFIYWDTATSVTAAFTEERHGYQTGPDMREYAHEVLAAQWTDGLQTAITSIDGDGDTNAHGHISISGGTFFDEDLKHIIVAGTPQTLDPIAQILVYYLIGPVGAPVLKQRLPTDFAFINDSDSVWTGRVPFNELAGGTTWQLTEATNNNHVLVHLFATGGITNPIVAFQGQQEYSTIAAARAGAGDELNTLIMIGLGSKEIVPLATFILQTGNGMTNDAQAAIMSTATADYVDWRSTPRAGGGGVSVNEHDALAGRDSITNHSVFADTGGTRPFTGALTVTTGGVILTAGDLVISDGIGTQSTSGGATQHVASNTTAGANGATFRTFVTDSDPNGLITGNPGDCCKRVNGTDSREYQHRGSGASNDDWVEFSTTISVASSGGLWRFDDDVTGSAPSSGSFKYNNATPASVTTVRIHKFTRDGKDHTNFLALLKDGDRFISQEETDSSRADSFEIIGAPINQTNHFDFPVAHEASNVNLIRDNRACIVVFERALPPDALNDIGDVTAPSPSTGEHLEWSGSAWVNSASIPAHDLAGADHNSSTAAAFNAKISDANFDDSGDTRPPASHAFAGADHSVSTLAQVNTKISDATLDTSSASRPPTAHAIGGALHTASTLANLNTKISDATLDDAGDTRPPSAHTHLEADITDLDHTDATAFHTDASGDISSLTQKVTPTGADHLFINDAANSNAPRRALISSLPTGDDADAIHNNVDGEIVVITEKTAILGDDEIILESAADTNAKRSGKIRNITRPVGIWQVGTPHSVRAIASPTSRYEREVLVTKVTADFPKDTSSGTFTFILKAGADIDSFSTVTTLSILSGTSTVEVTGLSVTVSADSIWVAECTAIGTITGADILQVCTITAYTELN